MYIYIHLTDFILKGESLEIFTPLFIFKDNAKLLLISGNFKTFESLTSLIFYNYVVF